MALALAGTREAHVLGSQAFRLKDRAYATLGWPEPGWAVVRLSSADQDKFRALSAGLSPEPGGRGKRGVTRVRLAAIDETLGQVILKAAWRHLSKTTSTDAAALRKSA